MRLVIRFIDKDKSEIMVSILIDRISEQKLILNMTPKNSFFRVLPGFHFMRVDLHVGSPFSFK